MDDVKMQVTMRVDKADGSSTTKVMVFDEDTAWFLQCMMFIDFVNGQGYNLDVDKFFYHDNLIAEKAYLL